MKTFLLLLTLFLLAIPSAASNAGRERDDDTSFTGTWETIAGTDAYTVILNQVGKNVTGSFSPGNGKIFDGNVTDNKLTFKWTQDGGYEGTAVFTMDAGGKGFTGTSTVLKPAELTVTWNSLRPPVTSLATPPSTSFTGVWKAVSGTMPVKLKLQQSGNQVLGVLQAETVGAAVLTIREGIVVANTLRLKLERADDKVFTGELVMDEGGKSFKGNIDGVAISGTYEGDNPDDVDATGRPQASSGDKAPEKVTPAPISFTGVWSANFGEAPGLKLIFHQAGAQVTGQVKQDSADVGVISEGIVLGDTLRFKIMRSRAPVRG